MLLYIGLFTDNAFLFGFGVYNDLAVIAQYGLAVPVVAAFQRMLAPIAPHQMTVATGSALVGVGGVVVFQVLFLAGVISLQQAFGLVGAAMVLLVGAWILITGFVGRRAAMLQTAPRCWCSQRCTSAIGLGVPGRAATPHRDRKPIQAADMT